MVLLSILSLQSCLKEDDTESQKRNENEEEIRQYIATKNLTVQTTATGLRYYITQSNNTGRVPATGNQVSVQYIGKLLNGTVFDSSTVNKPLVFALNDRTIIPGFNEGVGLLKEGEKATLIIPSYLGYGNRSSAKVPSYSVLLFDIQLTKVRTEKELLKAYLDSVKTKNPDFLVDSTSSGLYHVVTKAGSGNKLTTGPVTVSYRGTFVNGLEFDKSSSYAFTIGTDPILEGWKEGIKLMKPNETGLLLIPSSLAYGAQGRGSIPPYSPLVFEITIK